jgi:hypothetical protein
MEAQIKTLWDTRQTARAIGLPSGKALDISRHRKTIDLPYIKFGKRIKYDPEIVAQWLRDHTVIPEKATPKKDEPEKVDKPAPRARRRRRLRSEK